jgi:hypothetical protein
MARGRTQVTLVDESTVPHDAPLSDGVDEQIRGIDQPNVDSTPPTRTATPSHTNARTSPCPYPTHRASDWTGAGGRTICGVCHPPANRLWLNR